MYRKNTEYGLGRPGFESRQSLHLFFLSKSSCPSTFKTFLRHRWAVQLSNIFIHRYGDIIICGHFLGGGSTFK